MPEGTNEEALAKWIISNSPGTFENEIRLLMSNGRALKKVKASIRLGENFTFNKENEISRLGYSLTLQTYVTPRWQIFKGKFRENVTISNERCDAL